MSTRKHYLGGYRVEVFPTGMNFGWIAQVYRKGGRKALWTSVTQGSREAARYVALFHVDRMREEEGR